MDADKIQPEVYQIKNLTFTYPNRETAALIDIDLTIGHGEFVTLCGPSGCGKTTLLRQLKPSTAPHGQLSGEIFFEGMPLSAIPARDAAAKIGFVLQSPENQIVTDKVWHELAFGLESLGHKTSEIRLRVAEMASFFGIQTWFHKPVAELSGGQKQMLALASIMALQPSALILDEPTSQLDPIAAGEFLATVGKINRELGVTVILTEHRLEEAFPLSTRVLVMDDGKIIADGPPLSVGLKLRGLDHGMFLAMPAPIRAWLAMQPGYKAGEEAKDEGNTIDGMPLTVRDGANWLSQFTIGGDGLSFEESPSAPDSPLSIALTLDDVWFKYEKNAPDVLQDLSFKANYGEFTTILGGNGAGKTTALSLITGLIKPYRGSIIKEAEAYMLPQDPQSLFVAKTVYDDLSELLAELKLSKEEASCRLAAMVDLCCLGDILESHPYDLSGGEQQRAALAKVLLLSPKILLLDEPTKGLDAQYKQVFAAILRKLTAAGAAVIMASHDVEFCAEHADRCALFFDGSVVSENTPRAFFSGNSFYTTSANRMSRDILNGAITAGDVIRALGGRVPSPPEIPDQSELQKIKKETLPSPPKPPKLTTLRKSILSVLILCFICTAIFTGLNFDGFISFIGGGGTALAAFNTGGTLYAGIILAFSAQIVCVTLTLTWKRGKTPADNYIPVKKRNLKKRTVIAAVIIFLTIPLTVLLGLYFFGDRRYYFISMLIILQSMLPFALVFEGRKPQARELVIIAVLCALGVVGRLVFFMLPQFKPLIAIVIISGVAFGSESGFLVGSMTMLISNTLFGQGPWTPFQMFALGLIGFLAGLVFRKGRLRRSRLALCVYGALAALVIYGGIVNPSYVLIYQGTPTLPMLLAVYLQGLPMDLIHSIATVTILAIISKPMLEKLDRIKVKYGLVE